MHKKPISSYIGVESFSPIACGDYLSEYDKYDNDDDEELRKEVFAARLSRRKYIIDRKLSDEEDANNQL